jgi:L-2,4-diaminobutyrate decarboxylase
MDPLSPALASAYDPERFRAEGHRMVDRLADYLRAAAARVGPVLPWVEPPEQLARWTDTLTTEPSTTLPELVDAVLVGSNHLHHPRYVGHQVTAPLPGSSLLSMLTALLNNGSAVYEMGPVAVPMERSALQWMARQAGLPPTADGVLTSGGSVGNLTALLAARQAGTGRDVWSEGAEGGPPLAILASGEAHYSVRRAAQLMGLGQGGVVPVPVDGQFRMRAEALPEAARQAEAQGRKVFAVVASAGSTATGMFDPLDVVADFCSERGLWLHVDGAHGAAAVLSPRYASLVRGIARADSLVWDAHKMMLLPALVTALLFRDGHASYAPFAQRADYLLRRETKEQWWDPGLRTLECTKRMMGVELYGALAIHGTAFFANYVTQMFDLGRRFAQMVREAGDFELAVEPDCNIVCFRHLAKDVVDLDGCQERVRRALLRSGQFYLVQTRLLGKVFLRVTLINPLTSEQDLVELLAAIRSAAVR